MAKSKEIFDTCSNLHESVAVLYEAWVDNEKEQALEAIAALESKLKLIKNSLNEV
jgi:hypothetical protein